MVEVEL